MVKPESTFVLISSGIMASSWCLKQIAKMEAVVQRDEGGRGIRKLCRKGGALYDISTQLFRAKRVTILTGFPCLQREGGANSSSNLPPTETDGPSGAIAICRALLRLDKVKEVVIATDECNASVLKACANEGLRKENSNSWRLEIFSPKLYWNAKEQEKLEMIAAWSSHIIAIERGSLAKDGNAYTMSGKVMGPDLMAPLDQLFQKNFRAKYPNYSTSCIGDGGNELGMGSISDLIEIHVPKGPLIVSASPSDTLLCASVSNWGGYAAAAALQVISNKSDKILIPSEEEEIKTIKAANNAGARDGITGEANLSVDGISIEGHLGILEELRSIAEEKNHQESE